MLISLANRLRILSTFIRVTAICIRTLRIWRQSGYRRLGKYAPKTIEVVRPGLWSPETSRPFARKTRAHLGHFQASPHRQSRGIFEGTNWRARHAVRIEPSLRLPSPKNGNISACGQRLSAISPRHWRNREAGDRSLNLKSPLLAGISPTIRDGLPGDRTAWLATQC